MISLDLQPINTYFQCLLKPLQQKQQLRFMKEQSRLCAGSTKGCESDDKPLRENASVNSRLSNTLVGNGRLSIPMHAEVRLHG